MRPDLPHYTDALRGVRATLRARARLPGNRPAPPPDPLAKEPPGRGDEAAAVVVSANLRDFLA